MTMSDLSDQKCGSCRQIILGLKMFLSCECWGCIVIFACPGSLEITFTVPLSNIFCLQEV